MGGGSHYDFTFARYNADGTLDTSFTGDGMLATAFADGTHDYGQSVAVQADGKIVFGGTAHNGSDYDFALARYYADGSLDDGTHFAIGVPLTQATHEEARRRPLVHRLGAGGCAPGDPPEGKLNVCTLPVERSTWNAQLANVSWTIPPHSAIIASV